MNIGTCFDYIAFINTHTKIDTPNGSELVVANFASI